MSKKPVHRAGHVPTPQPVPPRPAPSITRKIAKLRAGDSWGADTIPAPVWWIIVCLGFALGLAVGAVLGSVL